MLTDLKFVLRGLAKAPGFTLVAVATVALGLASATAVYSVANAVVFRPLPFRDEASLAWIWSTRPDRDRAFFSIPSFLELRRENRTVADLAAVTPFGLNLTGLGEPERILGWGVTPNLFSVLGVPPLLGRLPQAADDAPGATPVAVLGYGYWRRRFGADPGVVGRVIDLNGAPHTVVGVLPPDFLLPGWDNDIFVTLALARDARRADRSMNFLRAVARLRPGVTRAQAQAEFAALTQRADRLYPDTDAAITAPRFVPLRAEIVGGYRAALLLLLGAAAALLAVMGANLAGLLAARALGRQRDAALCSALGASPARLLRTQLLEGFVLALAGGGAGLVACEWGLDALVALAPSGLPRASLIGLDWHVFAAAAGCTLLTGLGIGLAPALRLARVAPQDVLKSGAATVTGRTRVRRVLVAAQLALGTILLVGTGLLLRSLQRLLAAPPGFVTHGVLAAQVSLPRATYGTVPAVTAFTEEYLRRLRALPGVRSASLTSVLPLTGINTRTEFIRPDRPPARPTDVLSAANRYVYEDFFATAGIPLLAGRDFRPGDDATGRRVVIIDEALARRDWPGENPMGKTIRISDGSPPTVTDYEIIGVAGPTKNFSLEEAGTPTFYFAARQVSADYLPFYLGRMVFVAKTAGDPLALKEAARRALRGIDANAAVSLRSFDEATAWARAPRLFSARLLGYFAAAAVLLAALGLYAITAQTVAARTRELGIRIALGADRARIARLVLGGGARLAGAGIGGGLVLAALLAPVFGRMLYGVGALDAVTYGTVAATLGLVTLLASWLPARRATRIDPIVALRSE